MSLSVVSQKSGKTYFLHSRDQQLKGGQRQMLYFFAGQPGDGAIDQIPEGYEISENTKTGLPLLKKSAKSTAP